MFHPQNVEPAVVEDHAASEGSLEKVKTRPGGLARQARKLKSIFIKKRTEVLSSSATLGQNHGKPLHEMQRRENIPVHGSSSTESLPAIPDEHLHGTYVNARELQVPDHPSISLAIPDQELDNLSTRPEEPTHSNRIDPSSIHPLTQTNYDFHGAFSDTSSTQQQALESNQPYTSQKLKLRRRRESHNLVERRRRDNINELIQQLSRLVPLHHFKDYNAELSRSERTGESLGNGPKKGDILNGTVNWTRDLMGALYGKIQQQSMAREYIDSLGGTWPFESNEEERRLQNEVIGAFDTNGNISFSSRPWDNEFNAKQPERFETWKSAFNAKGANHNRPALRTKASHGSLISFSGSVHSFTSLTYRSASGDIKTERAENISNFELSPENIDIVPGDKLRREEREAGTLPRVTLLPGDPETGNGPSCGLYFGSSDHAQDLLPSTQTFATSPTCEEHSTASGLGQDENGVRNFDKQSSKLTPEPHTSIDSLDGSRRDDVFPGNSQSLDEADPLATNQLAEVNDPNVQNQMQPPIAAKMDEAGLRPFHLYESGSRSSIASSNFHQDLVETDPRVTYLENKLVRLRWKCVCYLIVFVLLRKIVTEIFEQSCDRPFQIDVFEHDKGAALAAIQELDQSKEARDEPSSPLRRLSMFLFRIKFLFHKFSDKRETDEILPITNPPPTKADDIIKTLLNPADPDPERYVCVCFPSMTYKKYLHHVDVNKTIDDQQLFAAMQKKYYDWKPLWRRIFTLQTLARVEYFEVRHFELTLYAANNLLNSLRFITVT